MLRLSFMIITSMIGTQLLFVFVLCFMTHLRCHAHVSGQFCAKQRIYFVRAEEAFVQNISLGCILILSEKVSFQMTMPNRDNNFK